MADKDKTLTDIVGSGLSQWVRDPATGRFLTPQETVEKLRQAIEASDIGAGATQVDIETGQKRGLTKKEQLDIALAQLVQNISYQGSGFPTESAALLGYLGMGKGGSAEGFRNISRQAYLNNPSAWAISKDKIGQTIDVSAGVGKAYDPSKKESFGVAGIVLDPNQKTLTPEQLAFARENPNTRFLDPVTGLPVNVSYSPEGLTRPGEQGAINWQSAASGMPATAGFNSAEEAAAFAAGAGDNAGAALGLGAGVGYNPAREARKSAYDLLYQQFEQYGLGGLVTPLKKLIESNISPAEFTLRLRETDAYKKRFAANESRIKKGLRSLSEAEYIGLEDAYQGIMRQYGLPESYYTRGEMGRQEGFEKFIGGDVSPTELLDRIQTAQNRVINAAPEVSKALKQYFPEITNGDVLAYILDPENSLGTIKRKVTTSEIGSAAFQAALGLDVTRASELERYGVTGEQARQGFRTVAGVIPRGGQLAEFYKQSPYTQATAEQEVFGLAGATEAEKQRRKLVELETAAFSGKTGATGGALARERAGQF
jgi:hypothetical protein